MGRVLAREMGVDGITVNTLIVGAIRTPAEAEYGDPAEVERVLLEVQACLLYTSPSPRAS